MINCHTGRPDECRLPASHWVTVASCTECRVQVCTECRCDCWNSRCNENECRSAGAVWAAIASMSTSTPYNHGNRFAALTTDDDGDSADGRSFTVVDRRRPNKRARQRSSPSQAIITQLPQQQQQQQPRARRARMIYGKASYDGRINITAAMITHKKAVLCLDNIVKSCSVDDVLDHVSRLAIHVITSFKVKSRHYRDDADDEAVFDRAAFHICTYDDDREKLLTRTRGQTL